MEHAGGWNAESPSDETGRDSVVSRTPVIDFMQDCAAGVADPILPQAPTRLGPLVAGMSLAIVHAARSWHCVAQSLQGVHTEKEVEWPKDDGRLLVLCPLASRLI